jgi:ankyrin repeat protein
MSSKLISEVKKHNFEAVETLLKEGADVHADDDDALRWACYRNNTKMAKLLLEYGADATANNNAPISLVMFQYIENIELIKILVEHGAEIEDKHMSTAQENSEVFTFLNNHLLLNKLNTLT